MIDGLGEVVAVLLAGFAAGTINTIVGSGTLITFPTLLACGLPPVLANVSNTLGLVPGTAAGVLGYRAELAGQRRRVLRLLPASVLGAVAGALLLLRLPPAAFDAIVPALIALGCVLVVFGPAIQRRILARAHVPEHGLWWVWPAVLVTGVYGGYFGAAQGVLLMAILGIGVRDATQRHNATKNVLSLAVNTVAALTFLLIAPVDWPAAGLIAVSSVLGGIVGAKVGRRLPGPVLRGVIAVVGVTAIIALLSR